MPPSPNRPLTFNDKLWNYISLVDPSPLPTTNFLPSTDALSLFDRLERSTLARHDHVLYNIDKGVEMLADDTVDGETSGHSDGAVEAILEEGVVM